MSGMKGTEERVRRGLEQKRVGRRLEKREQRQKEEQERAEGEHNCITIGGGSRNN